MSEHRQEEQAALVTDRDGNVVEAPGQNLREADKRVRRAARREGARQRARNARRPQGGRPTARATGRRS